MDADRHTSSITCGRGPISARAKFLNKYIYPINQPACSSEPRAFFSPDTPGMGGGFIPLSFLVCGRLSAMCSSGPVNHHYPSGRAVR